MAVPCKVALTLLALLTTVAMMTEAQIWLDGGLVKDAYETDDKRDYKSSDLYRGELMNDNIYTKSEMFVCIRHSWFLF